MATPTPNWFASVMGTGIVAVALTGLPHAVPALTAVATGAWLLAAVLLVVLLVAFVAHPRSHLDDPVLAHFLGAPAMALLTVGAGTLLLGGPLLGDALALRVDAVLWTLGTLLGVATAVVVPVAAITRHDLRDDSPSGGWLVPVVPPMVSAATGALLVPHAPAGEPRETLLLLCYALFGASLVAGMAMLVLLWGRLLRHGPGDPAGVPTVWIGLGVLGQSVTAAHHLGAVAPGAVPAPYDRALGVAALLYGVPVWGFAMLWLGLCAGLTVHVVRRGMPFAPSWWSFTFPLGTVVTGTSALAATTGLVVLVVLAWTLAAALVGAWTLVAVRTVRHLRPGPSVAAQAPVSPVGSVG